MTKSLDPVCEVAIMRHQNLIRWKNLWSILLYIVGILIVFFFALAIYFFFQQSLPAGAVAFLTGLVQSGGGLWIRERRGETALEEKVAYDALRVDCRNGGRAAAETVPGIDFAGAGPLEQQAQDDILIEVLSAADKRRKTNMFGLSPY
ncbi:MAG: hypothetical protein R3293_21270 [Candidatus Promineifilaceae bacterium]|nr:hypothetical protein [Candidatus Promineifilaceae bacterium]